MDDEIYLRHVAYHRLIQDGCTKDEASLILEGPGFDKLKRIGAMGLAGIASMTATPNQADAAPPTEIRQTTEHNYGTIMGHKVHYAGKVKENGKTVNMVVVEVDGQSSRDMKIAGLAAKAGVGQLISGKQNYDINTSGVSVTYKKIKGNVRVAIAKHDPAAAKQIQDLMGNGAGKTGGNNYERRVADTDF